MRNNKIKMAEKNGVQEEITPTEKLLAAAENSDFGGIIAAIIEMSDDDFDKLSDGMYKSFEKTFNSIEYRNTIAQKVANMTRLSYEKEKEGYEGVQKFIDELELPEPKSKFIRYILDNAYTAIQRYDIDPSEHIKVVVKKLNDNAVIPTYAHPCDAGVDLYVSEDCVANAGEVTFVHTGLAMKIPKGYEGQIRPRSGMSAKTKIRISNAPGTIDSNYRGEIQILVDNYGSAPFVISKGDRIAQMVFNKVPTADFEEGEVETEKDNTRGENGFGSSGTNNNNE